MTDPAASLAIQAEALRLKWEHGRAKREAAFKPQSLIQAIKACLDSVQLIEPEQEKLRSLRDEEDDPVRRNYLEYQIDLVALQLNRAAEVAKRRYTHMFSILDWNREKERCRKDILHWFRHWAWTLDPRQDSPLAIIPFDPFPFQEDTIHWLDDLYLRRRSDGVVEKSRDQGWTWISTAWSVYHWSLEKYFQALFGSKNEDAVDSVEEPDTILEKVRFQLRLLPLPLMPEKFNLKTHMGFMKITNPENGSVIAGEAPIPNFGRSGRYSIIFFDEHAAWPHSGRPQWTAASAASKTKISASTPQGTQTKQAELAKGKLPKLTLKWDLHPWKDQRWYNGQVLSMDEQEIAQEIDIDYEASQPGPIYAKFWDKQYHVIKWSEFAAVFGVNYKPHSWPCTIYQDVGTAVDHPTATGWYTRPTQHDGQVTRIFDDATYTYDLTDMAILYRTFTVYDMEIGDIWDHMCLLMRPRSEREQLKVYRMSHEAESERKTLRKNGALPGPVSWTPGRTRGISQFKSALKLKDTNRPNPFRPWLSGRPEFIIVVADDQYDDPVDDFGMARFQAEIAAYHFPKQVLGEPVHAQVPYAFFNDHMDQSRMAAADGFVPLVALTKAQQAEAKLRPELQLPAIVQEKNEALLQIKIQSRELYLKRMAAAAQQSSRRTVPQVRFRR